MTRWFTVAAVAGVLLTTGSVSAAIELFVAPDGKDTNPGTKDQPLATLEAARDRLRDLHQRPELWTPGGAVVYLRGGVYPRATTFALVAGDGGSVLAPVVYRAFGDETVRLIGGQAIRGFQPVTDDAALKRLDPAARGHVVQVDLKAQGIAAFGALQPRGFGRATAPAPLELFVAGQPLTLARWPNEGEFAKIADVPQGAKDRFAFAGDRPGRWVSAADAWLHGYWTQDWADSFVKVKAIDAASATFVLADPQGVYGYKKGQRYYALNLLEELDAPGEYYLDRATGMLYAWLPGDAKPQAASALDALVSLLEQPLVTLTDVSHVTFRGLTFECSRASGLRITGGAHVIVAGCTLRNLGTDGVVVSGGTHHQVVSCDLYNLGDAGISLSGGDRKTLTPCDHAALNNHIHHYSRWVFTYKPAVGYHGVGIRIAHNLIHDAPHTGILGGGNEIAIEFNELHHLALQTGDVGAIYTGRDWTLRGQVIRHNYIHDLGGVGFGAMGVYLDDAVSGITITGNLFVRAKRAAFVGGGRDNVITNNIMVECDPAIWIDARGLGWARQHIAVGGDWRMYEQLQAVRHDQPPFATKYPGLANIVNDEPAAPKGNVVRTNIAWQCKQGLYLQDKVLIENQAKWLDVANNLIGEDPGFLMTGPGKLAYRLRDDAPARKLGFVPLPVEQMGLQLDEYRRGLPE